MANGRHNVYDGVEEFWVVTKETGKRQESQSYEEIHEKNQQAWFVGIRIVALRYYSTP